VSIQEVAQHAEDRHVSTLLAMFVNSSLGMRRLNSCRHRGIMLQLITLHNPFKYSGLRAFIQLDVPGAGTAFSPT